MTAHAIHPSAKGASCFDEPATILVVEDDEPIRLAIRELLEVEGYDVVVAADGEEALQQVARCLPSLIVTDLQMPRIDGAQLTDRLRRTKETEEIPIVVLTAAHRIDGIEGRVDAVLRKPFDVDALLSTVAQFIRPTLPPRPMNAPPSVRLTLGPARASFVLFVTPGTTSSTRAERTVRRVAQDNSVPLEVVDVSRDEPRARVEGVAITPTLIRTLGRQRDVFLGDLSEPMLVEEFVTGA